MFPTPLGYAVGEKGTNMSNNKETRKSKSGFNTNRTCYLTANGNYYCYERWDDDAKCVVTQRIEVGKDLSLELTIMLNESDHDMDLQDRYEAEQHNPLFDAKVNSYKADPDNEDAVDPWDTLADKGGSLEDAMFAEREQENPHAEQARRIIDEECTESQQDFFFEHFGMVNRVLVVAPLSILDVWEEEFEKLADFPYSLTILKGTSAKKKEQLTKLSDEGLQVVVVNYESAWRLEKELLAYKANLVIADESYKLKENRTHWSKWMHHIGDKARYKLFLTGTVITNRKLDVFSQYCFLDPQIFGTSFYVFRNRYYDMGGYGTHTPIFRKWMTDDFLWKLYSVAFRVKKAECLDLPAITEEARTVDLEKDAIKLYDSIEDESYAELYESELTTANTLTRLLRQSQITGGHLTDDDGVVNPMSRAKLDALSNIIDSAMFTISKWLCLAAKYP